MLRPRGGAEWRQLAWLALISVVVNQVTANDCGNFSAPATCTATLLRELYNTFNTTSNMTEQLDAARLGVDKFLVDCLGAAPSGLRPINVLTVPQYLSVTNLVVDQLAQEAGWQAKVMVQPSLRLVAEVQDAVRNNVTNLYDVVVYSNKYLPDMGRLGLFMNLQPLVSADLRVNWADVTPYYRDAAAYGGQIVGMPLVGITYALFYRRDFLAAQGITEPPHVWEDLVELAERFNGTDFNGDGVPDHSVCHVLTKFCQAPHILLDIATNILQYDGPKQGCLYDTSTLEPFVMNPGFAKSMEVYRRLAAVNPQYQANITQQDPDCASGINSFLQGSCLFVIANSQVLKGTLTQTDMQGKIGSAMVPGFTYVLDRQSNTLTTCTPSLCPHAEERRLLNGTTALVNYAPWKGTVGYSGSISASVPKEYQQAAFDYLAIATTPEFAWAGVLDNATFNAPLRDSMISNPDAVQRFVNHGYNRADVEEWLAVTKATLSSGNVVMVPGLPDPDVYQDLFEAAGMNLSYRSPYGDSGAGWTADIADVQQMLYDQLRAVIASQGPLPTLRKYYLSAIGAPPPPPPPAQGPSEAPAEGGGLSGGTLAAIIVPVVTVGCGAIVALVLLALQLQRARMRSLGGAVKPPGVGPGTTLLITDIEGSTRLFEELDPNVMDLAMTLHHETVREVCLRHRGYEWSTEGDSFLLCFHAPRDAVLFAADVQVALLACEWPAALLQHPLAEAVYVVPNPAHKTRRGSGGAASLLPCTRDAYARALAAGGRTMHRSSLDAPYSVGGGGGEGGGATAPSSFTGPSSLPAVDMKRMVSYRHARSGSLRSSLKTDKSLRLPSKTQAAPAIAGLLSSSQPSAGGMGLFSAVVSGSHAVDMPTSHSLHHAPSLHRAGTGHTTASIPAAYSGHVNGHNGYGGPTAGPHSGWPAWDGAADGEWDVAPPQRGLSRNSGEGAGGFWAAVRLQLGSFRHSLSRNLSLGSISRSARDGRAIPILSPVGGGSGNTASAPMDIPGAGRPEPGMYGAGAVGGGSHGVLTSAESGALSRAPSAAPTGPRGSVWGAGRAGGLTAGFRAYPSSGLRDEEASTHGISPHAGGAGGGGPPRADASARVTLAGSFPWRDSERSTAAAYPPYPAQHSSFAAQLMQPGHAAQGAVNPVTMFSMTMDSVGAGPKWREGNMMILPNSEGELSGVTVPVGSTTSQGVPFNPMGPPAFLGTLAEGRGGHISGGFVSGSTRLSSLEPGPVYLPRFVQDQLQQAVIMVPGSAVSEEDSPATLLFRGLRVRIGMHSGVDSPDDIQYNRTSGRMQYTGPALAAARAVQGAACGGMCLMSEATAKLLPVEALRGQVMIGHEGEHVLQGFDETPPALGPVNTLLSGDTEPLPPSVNLYSVLPHTLVHRVPLMAGRLKSLSCLVPAWHSAPYGRAAVCFMHVVGVANLRGWNAEVTEQSLMLWREVATSTLCSLGGYLVEAAEGMLLVAFPTPAQAARWALAVISECLEVPWPEALLEHELGEEVAVHTGLLPETPPASGPLQPGAVPAGAQAANGTVDGGITAPRVSHEGGSKHGPAGSEGGSVRGARDVSAAGDQGSTAAAGGSAHGGTAGGTEAGGGAGGSAPVDAPHGGTSPGDNPTDTARTSAERLASPIARAASLAPGLAAHTSPPQPPAPPLARRRSSVWLTSAASLTRLQTRTLLFRGLRIKCGLDYGSVACDLHATTGRITYRGRCLNRASRIAGVAKTGQVWTSADAWGRAEVSINDAPDYGLCDATALLAAQHTARQRRGSGLGGSLAVHDAHLGALCAGHTHKQVMGTHLPPMKLKGISDEMPLVALSFQETGLGVLAAKNTVDSSQVPRALRASSTARRGSRMQYDSLALRNSRARGWGMDSLSHHAGGRSFAVGPSGMMHVGMIMEGSNGALPRSEMGYPPAATKRRASASSIGLPPTSKSPRDEAGPATPSA